MLLEIEKVNQTFRTGFWMKSVHVLHDVSLSVPEKSVYGFLGANGAGKTTLIQLIVGLRKPTSGAIRIQGKDAFSAEARRLIGYLPERPYFHEHLTGAGLLRYFGSLSGLSASQCRSRIPEVLKAVGLSHAKDRELKKYSKGMLQRIGIAQAILHNPQFLILDEPMSGLDPVGRKEMRELILKLAGEGRTVFFSSHVIPDVEAICDQVAVIQKGKVTSTGNVQNLLSQGEVRTEIAFRGMSLQQARAISSLESVREMPDGIRATIQGKTPVSEVLSSLIASKSEILWVTPQRPTLEQQFEEIYK
jgi:ABC-2 type transport system ATP-binding protein